MVPRLLQTEHTQRVADLLQHLQLRLELADVLHPGAHKNVEHVFHGAEVFLDRLSDGAHQLDARARQTLARLLDLLLAGEHLAQVVGLSDGADPLVIGSGARDVIEEAVDEIDGRSVHERRFAAVDEALELPIGLPDEALQGHARLEPVAADCDQHGSEHRPELADLLGGGHLFQSGADPEQLVDVSRHIDAANPAEQGCLERRTKPLRGALELSAGSDDRRRGVPGLQMALEWARVQQQQGAFRQRGLVACNSQIIQ